ncbi:transglycosylase SLT domain-containing protein [Streptomyces sp. RB6PN25]|uniref:Transglycosylase SLT domain-containing protein n=1 Tax=Streptomyces humicola TaxID=2953240 RepID=A0ABT1PQN4_9ACTN|nr:transglycosylase SLT domain-containing protein [Streptomyces humicola]MCQ4079974.1 transglycosylase SLT domain-containing protein [Streptomyces humicola]
MPISATKRLSASVRNRLFAAGGVATAALALSCAVVPSAQAATAPAAVHTKVASSTAGAPGNLNSWISQALSVMKQHGIPGSYNGIYRNVMRESSGNPAAENNWDSNAAAGIPSKGLLQVIQPTFTAYHVPGTSSNIEDPVANIAAACNYAAHKYGSIDNVDSAY